MGRPKIKRGNPNYVSPKWKRQPSNGTLKLVFQAFLSAFSQSDMIFIAGCHWKLCPSIIHQTKVFRREILNKLDLKQTIFFSGVVKNHANSTFNFGEHFMIGILIFICHVDVHQWAPDDVCQVDRNYEELCVTFWGSL